MKGMLLAIFPELGIHLTSLNWWYRYPEWFRILRVISRTPRSDTTHQFQSLATGHCFKLQYLKHQREEANTSWKLITVTTLLTPWVNDLSRWI